MCSVDDACTCMTEWLGVYVQVLKDGTVSCVIDSEAVAWDREKQQILPFQVLSTRKRKVLVFL